MSEREDVLETLADEAAEIEGSEGIGEVGGQAGGDRKAERGVRAEGASDGGADDKRAGEGEVEGDDENAMSVRSSLEQAEARLARAEMMLVAQRLLADAGAVDVESGAVLIERALAGSSVVGGGACDEAAVAEAVKALKRRKPRLFAASAGIGGSSVWGRGGASSGAWTETGDEAERRLAALAERATRSGDRRSVMRYLQERRSMS